MKRTLLFLILLFLTLNFFSQKQMYYDESMKKIDSALASKKCKSLVLKCYQFKQYA